MFIAIIQSVLIQSAHADTASLPILTGISFDSTSFAAGERLVGHMSIDGQGKNIAGFLVMLAPVENGKLGIGGILCSSDLVNLTSVETKLDNGNFACGTSRTTKTGLYGVVWAEVWASTCNLSPAEINSQQNSNCLQPLSKITNPYSGSVNPNSVATSNLVGLNLQGGQSIYQLPFITLNPALPVKRPTLTSSQIEMDWIDLVYKPDFEQTCTYSSGVGVASLDPYKVGGIRIAGIKPNTNINLNGDCKSTDGQTIQFSDSFTSKKPPAPVISQVKAISDVTSIRFPWSNIARNPYTSVANDNINYVLTATQGKLSYDGVNEVVSGLQPNTSITITVTATDNYGQTSSADLGPFTTLSLQSKTKTVFCLKGKVIKKISGINPVCPKGFKLK